MCTNVVYFRVVRRLCRREWNWLWNWRCVNQHSWDPWQRTTWSRRVTSDFNSVFQSCAVMRNYVLITFINPKAHYYLHTALWNTNCLDAGDWSKWPAGVKLPTWLCAKGTWFKQMRSKLLVERLWSLRYLYIHVPSKHRKLGLNEIS